MEEEQTIDSCIVAAETTNNAIPCQDLASAIIEIPKKKKKKKKKKRKNKLNIAENGHKKSRLRDEEETTPQGFRRGGRGRRRQKSTSESSQEAPESDDKPDKNMGFVEMRGRDAVVAQSVGFPPESLTEDEIEYGVVSTIGEEEQTNYIAIRNYILARWRDNVEAWLSMDQVMPAINDKHHYLLSSAYQFLHTHGFINFGVAPSIKGMIPSEPSKCNVVIIGAGFSGLSAARQLPSFGFKVVLLEGRKRPGGRVYTTKIENGNTKAAADLGGSIIYGHGNPLVVLAKQLNYPLHKIREKCPLYLPDGRAVDGDVDNKIEGVFNRLLDRAGQLRQVMGETAVDISLGTALDTFRTITGVAEDDAIERRLLEWHLANLEYCNAGLVSRLSLAFWDQDDPYEMGGDHCLMPGGNGRLVHGLAESVPILYEKTVNLIRYGSDGVQVICSSGQVFQADMALCTVPLGVLKNKTIKFIPESPQKKIDAINRLGFGLLNKVTMLFPHVFWDSEIDSFGHLCDDRSRRGEFFLFYSYASVSGGPVLIALVAGEAAIKFETMPPEEAVTRVLEILKGIYSPRGIKVPDPLQSVCTRWGNDNFSRGSYSHVAVGASGDDYDILAENVGDGRLFFAGEATIRQYPATMHGAFLSGLREAANILNFSNARLTASKVDRSLSKDIASYATLLADLFRHPDLEFGSFSVLFDPNSEDHKSMALLRVMISTAKRKGTDNIKVDQQQANKIFFQQLHTHLNQHHVLYLYTLVTQQQALQLREVRGGDESQLKYLYETLKVKLVGRRGLGAVGDSLVTSIKSARAARRPITKHP